MNAPVRAALFRELLGAAAFDALPAPVRALHLHQGLARYHGEVDVERGRSLLSRLCSWATRLPPAGRCAIEVEICATPGRESWTRHVRGHAMRSRLRGGDDGLLIERLGAVEFGFRLQAVDGAIVWKVARVRVLGMLPLPSRWFARVGARESAADGRYCFDVAAALPVAGLLVHYRGWLDVP